MSGTLSLAIDFPLYIICGSKSLLQTMRSNAIVELAAFQLEEAAHVAGRVESSSLSRHEIMEKFSQHQPSRTSSLPLSLFRFVLCAFILRTFIWGCNWAATVYVHPVPFLRTPRFCDHPVPFLRLNRAHKVGSPAGSSSVAVKVGNARNVNQNVE